MTLLKTSLWLSHDNRCPVHNLRLYQLYWVLDCKNILLKDLLAALDPSEDNVEVEP